MKNKLTLLLRQMIIQKSQHKQSFSNMAQFKERTSQQGGFTLMELLVVMFIIAALSVPALLVHQRIRDWMHKQEFYSLAKNFEKKAQAHYVRHIENRKRAALGESTGLTAADFELIPNPRNKGFSTQCAGYQNGTLCMIGQTISVGPLLQINGETSYAAGYTAGKAGNVRSYFQYFDDVHDNKLTIDGWVKPTLTVVFVPTSQNLTVPYCPVRDSNTPKILYVSSGRNHTFAVSDITNHSLKITAEENSFVGSANENKPFEAYNVDGFPKPFLRWNRNWRPEQWQVGGSRNDNLYYKISFDALDQKYLDESIKRLRSIETTLKNSFYTKISGHMEMPTPDANPTQSSTVDCTSDKVQSTGLFMQPSKGNWFQIRADGKSFKTPVKVGTKNYSSATPQMLSNITGMAPAEMTDAWGNAILWDSSVNGSKHKRCKVLDPESNFQRSRLPTEEISYDFDESGNFVPPPYSARVFSACGYQNGAVSYNALRTGTSGDTLWHRGITGPVVYDTNLTITVPGMF